METEEIRKMNEMLVERLAAVRRKSSSAFDSLTDGEHNPMSPSERNIKLFAALAELGQLCDLTIRGEWKDGKHFTEIQPGEPQVGTGGLLAKLAVANQPFGVKAEEVEKNHDFFEIAPGVTLKRFSGPKCVKLIAKNAGDVAGNVHLYEITVTRYETGSTAEATVDGRTIFTLEGGGRGDVEGMAISAMHRHLKRSHRKGCKKQTVAA